MIYTIKYLSRLILSIAMILIFSEHAFPDQGESTTPPAGKNNFDNFIISLKPGLKYRAENDFQIKVTVDHPDSERKCDKDPSNKDASNRKDYIGLALSGGISKGFAQIGALQFLDRLGIRINGIVGTSFGAIVGAFYAAGYSADEIAEIVTNDIEWQNLFTDLPSHNLLDANRQIIWGLDGGNNIIPRLNQDGLRSGQNIYPIFNRFLLPATMISGNCFDQLYIPFRATATNLSKKIGKDTQDPLDRGNLINAVKASFAFPIIFSPVFIEGQRYRDGGIQKNLPIEDVKNMGRYKIIIAVDTTDDDPPELSPKRMFPIASVFDVINEGGGSIGTALTQEVYRQTKLGGLKECGKKDLTGLYEKKANDTTDSNQSSSSRPCLIHIKIKLKGGFLDFEKEKIEDAIALGFKSTEEKFCELASEDPSTAKCKQVENLPKDNQKQNQFYKFIEQCCFWKGSGSPKETRNQNEEKSVVEKVKSEISMGDRVFSEAERQKVDRALIEIKKLKELYNENHPSLKRQRWTDHDELGENILQGVELSYGPDGSLKIRVDEKLTNQEEQELVGPSLDLLIKTIEASKSYYPSTDLPFSSAKIVFNNGTLTVKLYSWRYSVEKGVFRTDFTEKGNLELPQEPSLDGSSEILFGFKPEEIDTEVKEIKENYSIDLCTDLQSEVNEDPVFILKTKTTKKDSYPCLSQNEESKTKLKGLQQWKEKIFSELKSLELKTELTKPDKIGQFLNGTLEDYYANGHIEYVRVENVERGKIVLSEKTNYPDSGMLYFNYHFDTENEHTFSSKLTDHSNEGSFFQWSVALLDRFQEGDGGNANGIYAGLFTNIFGNHTGGATSDLYYAKRVQNIRNEGSTKNDFSQLIYYQLGIQETFTDLIPIKFFPDFRLELYKISSVESNYVPSDDSSRIQESAELLNVRRVFKPSIGLKKVTFTKDGVESHDRSLSGIFSSQEWSPSLFLSYSSRKDRELSLKGVFGAIISKKEEKLPISELYSLGGYYPLREEKVWGGNRFDFIGSGLNEEWGQYLFLLEARYPLCYYQGLKIIHRNWDTSLSFVASFGNTANTFGKLFDRTNLGFGLDLSLYLPIISTLQPKFNIAWGMDRSNYSHENLISLIRDDSILYFSASILL